MLSDMRLPDEDGIALLQWMAGAGVAAPVIVMTSYAEIQNAVRCMKLGARDYVAKPVNPDELLKKIREALDEGRFEEFRNEYSQRLAALVDKADKGK